MEDIAEAAVLDELIFAFLKRRRSTEYKGIGWRGGLLLAIYWAAVCGTAAGIGWDITGIILSGMGGALIGYRLEKIGGAIAVAIFSVLLWLFSVELNGNVPMGIGLGTLSGFGIALRTRE